MWGAGHMEKIIQAISKAQDHEIQEMMTALLKRHKELFPNWELSVISIEKTGDRNRQIDEVIQLLEKLKDQRNL